MGLPNQALELTLLSYAALDAACFGVAATQLVRRSE